MLWDVDQLVKQPNKSPQYANYESVDIAQNTLVVWSPDGKFLAIGNSMREADNSIVEINAPSSTLSFAQHAPQITVPDGSTIYGLAWLNNKQLITLTQPDTINNNKYILGLRNTVQAQAQPQSVAFQGYISLANTNAGISTNMVAVSPDGSQVAMLPYGKNVLVGRVSVVNNATHWQLIHSLQFQADQILTDSSGVGWSADGKSLVALANQSSNQGLVYWNLSESKPQLHALLIPDTDSNTQFSTLACNPASTNPGFATGNQNGEVYLWQFVNNSSPLKTLDTNGIKGTVTALAWSHDGHWLAASFSDANASILIWKI